MSDGPAGNEPRDRGDRHDRGDAGHRRDRRDGRDRGDGRYSRDRSDGRDRGDGRYSRDNGDGRDRGDGRYSRDNGDGRDRGDGRYSRDRGDRGDAGNRGPGDDRRDSSGRHRGAARLRGDGARSAQAPSERRRGTDAPRAIAFGVLVDVELDDAYANLVLPKRLARAGLYGRDAGFATELAYGTLRLQGRYDAIIERCLDRPLSDLDPEILVALRLGAHQLLSMRVPPHAAVSQTVGLVRERIGAGPGQLANAVLRRVGERTWEEWQEILLDGVTDETARLAITTSHPAWVIRALRGALVADGRDAGELPGLLEADNVAAKVMLVARPGLIDQVDLIAEVPGSEEADYAPTGVLSPGTAPRDIRDIADGLAGVQDEGSQLVTLALAAVPVSGPDERWLDMCAGPGGKAALLASIAAQRGARIVANESQPHRTELVADALRAVPTVAIEDVVTGDGREIGRTEPGGFDRVLVDAPCTGLGALRRRPEARWRKHPSDVPALASLQRELLESALAAVREGGIVAYVTCSPHPAETRVVVDDVLRGRDDIEVLDAVDALRSVSVSPIELGPGPHAQLWPDRHRTDAMHLTLLRRLG